MRITLNRRRIGLGLLTVAVIFISISIELRSHDADASVLRADPETILADPILRRTALVAGKPVYSRYCASCHGESGKGDPNLGVPDLTDKDHLYGEGKVADIQEIVRFGIRANNKRGWNLATMPRYASAVPYKTDPLPSQSPAQIESLTQLLLSFTGRATDPVSAERGKAAYESAGCWDCHGHQAEGDPAIGAPNLTDRIWLYGGGHDAIYRSIAAGRAGFSPAFERRLTPAQTLDVAVYVASLAAEADDKP